MATSDPLLTASGQQPVIDYLTKDYAGFRQGMLNQIPLLLPEWTDRSEADFGVVLIELFAYVADILSYYQDRVANEAYLRTATQRRSVAELLRLIGYQIDPGLAATALIHLDVTGDVTLAGATLPYRLKTSGSPGEPDVTFEITQEASLRVLNNAIDLDHLGSIAAGSGALVVPRSAHALVEGDRIYLEETSTDPAGRPRKRRSSPLTVTRVSPVSATDDELAWLEPLAEPFAPASTLLKGNNVLATHGETIGDEPVFVADGSAYQRLRLSRRPLTHVLRDRDFRRRRSRAELEVRVAGNVWNEVENLFAAGPGDACFATSIDEDDRLTVQFGNGKRGAVPPAGAPITARYRIGLGSGGNVGADKLNLPVSAVPQVRAVNNPFPARGGADRESTEEAKISGPGSVIAQERAVTLQDYERLARAYPGVGKAKARVGLRGGYKVVQLFMAPENPTTIPPALPSGELKEALKHQLEARMPVNRMAGVDVLDPTYVQADVAVDVYLQADASQVKVVDAARAVLRDLLSFARREFGQPVRVGEVFAALHPLPGIAYVMLKRLARSGGPAPATPCGFADLVVRENELVCEGRLEIDAVGGLP
jgi:hypothetical protein